MCFHFIRLLQLKLCTFTHFEPCQHVHFHGKQGEAFENHEVCSSPEVPKASGDLL